MGKSLRHTTYNAVTLQHNLDYSLSVNVSLFALQVKACEKTFQLSHLRRVDNEGATLTIFAFP